MLEIGAVPIPTESNQKMHFALPPELEAYVAEQTSNGRFGSASEMIVYALRHMIIEDKTDAEYFRERLRRSEEDIAAGRVVRADDTFFEAKRQMIRDRHMRPTE